jgi:hypothetical protein
MSYHNIAEGYMQEILAQVGRIQESEFRIGKI